MQLDVFLDSSARSDLIDIWIYISENSASDVIADRFVNRIKARCEKIGNAPNGGRPRDDILPACE